MDGKRPVCAGLLVLSLMVPCAAQAQAEPPVVPAASAQAPTPEQRRAQQQAAMAERVARNRAEVDALIRRTEQQRSPTAEQARQWLAEQQRTAPERAAQRREALKKALVDGPELDMREALTEQAKAWFAARDFAALDRSYDGYTQRSERTPSGLWKSGFVSVGAEQALGPAQNDEQFERADALLQQWLSARPDSTLAHLLRARLMVQRAWAYRGDGYAASVEEANWRPFFDGLRRTKEYLEAHKPVASASPEYYSLTITVLKGLQKSPFPTFDEGLERFPGYYPIYFSMLDYLLPKWHGSTEQIEHFASEAVARTQQAEGRGMYARIYWYAAQSQFHDNLFLQSKANWERMRAGFDDVIARYPDQWNLQNYASFACDANDEETLKKLFERIREPSLDEAWRSHERYLACGRRVGKFKD